MQHRHPLKQRPENISIARFEDVSNPFATRSKLKHTPTKGNVASSEETRQNENIENVCNYDVHESLAIEQDKPQESISVKAVKATKSPFVDAIRNDSWPKSPPVTTEKSEKRRGRRISLGDVIHAIKSTPAKSFDEEDLAKSLIGRLLPSEFKTYVRSLPEEALGNQTFVNESKLFINTDSDTLINHLANYKSPNYSVESEMEKFLFSPELRRLVSKGPMSQSSSKAANQMISPISPRHENAKYLEEVVETSPRITNVRDQSEEKPLSDPFRPQKALARSPITSNQNDTVTLGNQILTLSRRKPRQSIDAAINPNPSDEVASDHKAALNIEDPPQPGEATEEDMIWTEEDINKASEVVRRMSLQNPASLGLTASEAVSLRHDIEQLQQELQIQRLLLHDTIHEKKYLQHRIEELTMSLQETQNLTNQLQQTIDEHQQQIVQTSEDMAGIHTALFAQHIADKTIIDIKNDLEALNRMKRDIIERRHHRAKVHSILLKSYQTYQITDTSEQLMPSAAIMYKSSEDMKSNPTVPVDESTEPPVGLSIDTNIPINPLDNAFISPKPAFTSSHVMIEASNILSNSQPSKLFHPRAIRSFPGHFNHSFDSFVNTDQKKITLGSPTSSFRKISKSIDNITENVTIEVDFKTNKSFPSDRREDSRIDQKIVELSRLPVQCSDINEPDTYSHHERHVGNDDYVISGTNDEVMSPDTYGTAPIDSNTNSKSDNINPSDVDNHMTDYDYVKPMDEANIIDSPLNDSFEAISHMYEEITRKRPKRILRNKSSHSKSSNYDKWGNLIDDSVTNRPAMAISGNMKYIPIESIMNIRNRSILSSLHDPSDLETKIGDKEEDHESNKSPDQSNTEIIDEHSKDQSIDSMDRPRDKARGRGRPISSVSGKTNAIASKGSSRLSKDVDDEVNPTLATTKGFKGLKVIERESKVKMRHTESTKGLTFEDEKNDNGSKKRKRTNRVKKDNVDDSTDLQSNNEVISSIEAIESSRTLRKEDRSRDNNRTNETVPLKSKKSRLGSDNATESIDDFDKKSDTINEEIIQADKLSRSAKNIPTSSLDTDKKTKKSEKTKMANKSARKTDKTSRLTAKSIEDQSSDVIDIKVDEKSSNRLKKKVEAAVESADVMDAMKTTRKSRQNNSKEEKSPEIMDQNRENHMEVSATNDIVEKEKSTKKRSKILKNSKLATSSYTNEDIEPTDEGNLLSLKKNTSKDHEASNRAHKKGIELIVPLSPVIRNHDEEDNHIMDDIEIAVSTNPSPAIPSIRPQKRKLANILTEEVKPKDQHRDDNIPVTTNETSKTRREETNESKDNKDKSNTDTFPIPLLPKRSTDRIENATPSSNMLNKENIPKQGNSDAVGPSNTPQRLSIAKIDGTGLSLSKFSSIINTNVSIPNTQSSFASSRSSFLIPKLKKTKK